MSTDFEKVAKDLKELRALDEQLIRSINALEANLRAAKINLPLSSDPHKIKVRLYWREHAGQMRLLVPMGKEPPKPLTEVGPRLRTDLCARALPDLIDAIGPAYDYEIRRTERAVETIKGLLDAFQEAPAKGA